MNFLLKSLGLVGLVVLQSCGGDGSNPFVSGGDSTATLRMGSGSDAAFVDKAVGLSATSINTGGSVTLTVNFVDADDALTAAAGTVSFNSTCATSGAATISPDTEITIAGSSATATYTDVSCNGTDAISATATLDDGTSLTASATLSVAEVSTLGTGSGAGFTPGVLNIASTSILSGGRSTITVNVVDSSNALVTAPLNVTFTSTCSTSSQASFTPATTSNVAGTFTTTYIDNGCIGSDFITATLGDETSGTTASSQILINSLQLGTGSPFAAGSLALADTEINVGESTNVSVSVADNTGTLYTTSASIDFTSTCSELSPPLARFSPSSTSTVGGTAETTYFDLGCPANDSISATLNTVGNKPVATSSLPINPYRIGTGSGASFANGAISLGASSITVGDTTTVTTNIVDSNGALVNTLQYVTFSSTCADASPATAAFTIATVPTNNGVATTTYRDLGCPTGDNITATLDTVSSNDPIAFAALDITPLQIGTGSGAGFSKGSLTLGSSSINVGETTSVSVNIVDSSNALVTSQVRVNFSSFCADASPSTASFTIPSVITNTGTATTTYRDNGCPTTDSITATLDTVRSIDPISTDTISINQLKLGTLSGTFTEGALNLGSATITESESTSVSVDIVDSTNTLVTSPVSVTFTSSCADSSPATASFSSTTVVTSSGTASTTFKDEGCPTSDNITATLNTVSDLDPTATSAISITPLRIGDENGGSFTNGVVSLGLSNISAGGTTSVSADVVDRNGALITTPVTVSFDSNCVAQSIASFDNATASTINGTASVTYTAGSGCSGADTILATIDPFSNNTRTATADVTVASPGTGSIQFTSTSSEVIALKGTGNSSDLQESSTLTFTVVDNTGAPLSGQNVTFSLNTTLGGVTLQSSTDTSDASGLVQAIVQSGTVSTTVRVTATVDGTTFSTQSTAIVISTGLPDQDSFSLSAVTLNPRAWRDDGITVNITARLSDRFNNPIQDGTNINFTTELGSIVSSCSTVDGACSAIWTSSAPRGVSGKGTNAGRTTILAHVIGEESFTDADGNGVYSGDGTALGNNANSGDGRLSDTPPAFNDIPEPFVDWDEDGARDNGVAVALPLTTGGTPEPFKDFNGGSTYDAADGFFNGVVCTHATECGSAKATPQETTFVSKSIVLVMAEANPEIVRIVRIDSQGEYTAKDGTTSTDATTVVCDNTDADVTNDCYAESGTTAITYPSVLRKTESRVGGGSNTYLFTIVGGTNYQVLPAGTTITFAADNGDIISGAEHTVLNTNENTYQYDNNNTLQPSNLGAATYSVTLKADTTPSNDGSLSIEIDSEGLVTNFSPISVDDRIASIVITTPSATLTVTQGNTFTLNAVAYEPIAGDVSSAITWTSNLAVATDLPDNNTVGDAATVDTTGWTLGTHTLTATSNSNGTVLTDTIDIIVQ